ncbi:MAG: hypothetical protein QOF57_2199 [Frankiaceae bacterium]|jgi:DNA-binding response OmpR family regulator|nr:hypothetical protein [Frankiaceae bacterium]
MAFHVLVVDDDPTITDVVSRYLTRAGYVVSSAADGPGALMLVRTAQPDLVVLDLMLPGMSGLEVCRALRATSTVPVLMLTALAEAADRIVGLEFGADDYLAKPFDPRELVLRVEAILRRVGGPVPPSADVLHDGGLVVDLPAHSATLDGEDLSLTAREFDLLAHLMRHPREALSRGQLLRDVWGWSYGDESTVTVHVRRLREKVEADATAPRRLVTVWSVGYRFDPVGEETAATEVAGDAGPAPVGEPR